MSIQSPKYGFRDCTALNYNFGSRVSLDDTLQSGYQCTEKKMEICEASVEQYIPDVRPNHGLPSKDFVPLKPFEPFVTKVKVVRTLCHQRYVRCLLNQNYEQIKNL